MFSLRFVDPSDAQPKPAQEFPAALGMTLGFAAVFATLWGVDAFIFNHEIWWNMKLAWSLLLRST